MSETEKKVRLQKYIADLGIASRREAEQWIRDGRITLNGEVRRDMGITIVPGQDRVLLDGKKLANRKVKRLYLMLNKPDLYLTSRNSFPDQPSIYELPDLKRLPVLVAPSGRLDFRSEGLLILSNDGDFVYKLSHPRYKVPRYYEVLVPRALSFREEDRLKEGVYLDNSLVRGLVVRRKRRASLGGSHGMWYRVTVEEGRNRIVRRVFETVGVRVLRLIRVGIGELKLPKTLPTGRCVPILPGDVEKLKQGTARAARAALEARTARLKGEDSDERGARGARGVRGPRVARKPRPDLKWNAASKTGGSFEKHSTRKPTSSRAGRLHGKATPRKRQPRERDSGFSSRY